jgi:hypothetical protein
MTDMGDPAASASPSDRGFSGPDRRSTVDLVRAERGEPERRRQHRNPKPITEIGDSQASDDR